MHRAYRGGPPIPFASSLLAMAAMLGYWTQPFLHPLAASCHITKVADPVASGIEPRSE